MTVQAWKGHGTENDFVLLPDPDAVLSLSAGLVSALCDRHAGIGADGVLRVVRTELATEPDVRAQAEQARFFMDYRNADGSIAEMCGNGVRVFGRYLQQAGLLDSADGDTVIATRGGPRTLRFDGDAVSVVMGEVRLRPETPSVTATGLAGEHVGVAVDAPNPHVVVLLDPTVDLAALDLTRAPTVRRPLPDGQNVEFVVRTGDTALRLRVYERGSGETRSCGTGICAAVVAVAGPGERTGRWQIDVPGGRCEVWWQGSDLVLSGPAVLVSRLELSDDWLAAHR